jgi:hypothetical protein
MLRNPASERLPSFVAFASLLAACGSRSGLPTEAGGSGGGAGTGTGNMGGMGTGGLLAAGGCPPAVEATLVMSAPPGVNNIEDFQFLAIDSSFVYFDLYSAHEIGRVPKCGGEVEIIVGNLVSPLAVAVNDTHVYWLDQGAQLGEGKLARRPTAGGPVETLATGIAGPWPLALDGGHAYWGYDMGTAALPLSGGPISHLSDAHSYVGMALDDTYVYWGNDHSVGRFLESGGGDEVLAQLTPDPTTGDFVVWCAAADTSNVYVTVYIGPVFGIPKTGGAPVQLAPTAPYRCLTVDQDYVYAAADDGVRRIRKDGGGADVIGLSGTEIVADESNVFWGNGYGIWRWSKR